MPSYQYEAVDATGRSDRGMIDADSERSARHALRARGLLPLAVRETRKRTDRGGYAVA
ncbi:MAG TPA: type II secretion system protein GspF, partial [Pusillimonas sp.]